jgi:hypothetical protein
MNRWSHLSVFAARALRWSALMAVLLAAPANAEPARLESAHFRIQYDRAQLTPEQATAARDAAERGWGQCAKQFGSSPSAPVQLDLSPDFAGATGFARRLPGRGWEVAIRYADLDYVGLSGEYVLTHEVAHVFSGSLAGSPLGEGIADWATGTFNQIPMAPWWGKALRQADLWVDPDGLFITGEYPAATEVEARGRTAQYSEAALLVRFLVDRFGWGRFARFAARYSEARRTLLSNAQLRYPRNFARPPYERAPGAPVPLLLQSRPSTPPAQRSTARWPDPERVRRVFAEVLDESWDSLRARWLAEMDAAPLPTEAAARLVLGQQIYGAIRNYELWVVRQRIALKETDRHAIREAFTAANRALGKGDLKVASELLREATALVARLRQPESGAAAA